MSNLNAVDVDVISPPLIAISPAVVIFPVEPVTSKLEKSRSAVVPTTVFAPTFIAFPKSASETSKLSLMDFEH
jgi:hypothetical protein